MGINLKFVCEEHKKYHTPLRGSEGAAFQALVRIHGDCFKDGNMRVYHDGYCDTRSFEDFFPDHHVIAMKQNIPDQELYQQYIEIHEIAERFTRMSEEGWMREEECRRTL